MGSLFALVVRVDVDERVSGRGVSEMAVLRHKHEHIQTEAVDFSYCISIRVDIGCSYKQLRLHFANLRRNKLHQERDERAAPRFGKRDQ